MQARRTSIVPEDYTETFRNKQKDFEKVLLKESLQSIRCNKNPCFEANLQGNHHPAQNDKIFRRPRCNNNKRRPYFEANFSAKEENYGVKAAPAKSVWSWWLNIFDSEEQ